VSANPNNQLQELRAYIGGVRWRKLFQATWPLAKLIIEPSGVAVGPSSPRLRFMWRLFGLPILSLRWSEIDSVEVVRPPWERSPRGVSFLIDGKRLIFFSMTPYAIVDDLAQHVPEKIAYRKKPRVVF
jgi:hypothetical protein